MSLVGKLTENFVTKIMELTNSFGKYNPRILSVKYQKLIIFQFWFCISIFSSGVAEKIANRIYKFCTSKNYVFWKNLYRKSLYKNLYIAFRFFSSGCLTRGVARPPHQFVFCSWRVARRAPRAGKLILVLNFDSEFWFWILILCFFTWNFFWLWPTVTSHS